ncbi:MAG: hypothetical protein CMP26_00630 [Roseibacillus sp.]|nr:hypothetical protein [Roseibacillus sp.]
MQLWIATPDLQTCRNPEERIKLRKTATINDQDVIGAILWEGLQKPRLAEIGSLFCLSSLKKVFFRSSNPGKS